MATFLAAVFDGVRVRLDVRRLRQPPGVIDPGSRRLRGSPGDGAYTRTAVGGRPAVVACGEASACEGDLRGDCGRVDVKGGKGVCVCEVGGAARIPRNACAADGRRLDARRVSCMYFCGPRPRASAVSRPRAAGIFRGVSSSRVMRSTPSLSVCSLAVVRRLLHLLGGWRGSLRSDSVAARSSRSARFARLDSRSGTQRSMRARRVGSWSSSRDAASPCRASPVGPAGSRGRRCRRRADVVAPGASGHCPSQRRCRALRSPGCRAQPAGARLRMVRNRRCPDRAAPLRSQPLSLRAVVLEIPGAGRVLLAVLADEHPRVRASASWRPRNRATCVVLGVLRALSHPLRAARCALPPSRPHPHALSSSMSVAREETKCVPARFGHILQASSATLYFIVVFQVNRHSVTFSKYLSPLRPVLRHFW